MGSDYRDIVFCDVSRAHQDKNCKFHIAWLITDWYDSRMETNVLDQLIEPHY